MTSIVNDIIIRPYNWVKPFPKPLRRFAMRGQTEERWRELCELARVEQDPERLMVLVREITRLLEEKQARLSGRHDSSSTNTSK